MDSDEALQNAALRQLLGVNRVSAATSGNPAMALPQALHQTIRNLTTAQMQGLSPNQILQLHLAQMRGFVPDFALRTLESESQKFIIQTFGRLD